MRCKILFFLMGISFSAMSQDAAKQEPAINEKLDYSFLLRSETAYEIKNQVFQKQEFFIEPEITYKINNKVKAFIQGRIYAELFDQLEPGKPDQSSVSPFSRRLLIGNHLDLSLREFYLDILLGKKGEALRIGKQQVVWGETDGLKLLDMVNPQNFREFILDNFEDSRIPLWSVKLDLPVIEKLDVQLIWIPDQTYHIIPDFTATYFPVYMLPRTDISVVYEEVEKPSGIADSDWGLRLSSFVNGWDLTLNYLYAYDDFVSFRRQFQFVNPNNFFLQITPFYERLHNLGGSFNKTIGMYTFKGEGAFTFNRPFLSSDMGTPEGFEKSDQFLAAIGVELWLGQKFLSLQFYDDWCTESINAYNRNRHETNLTLYYSHGLLNNTLTLEFTGIQSLNRFDGLVRPGISYFLKSNLELTLGADVFYGNPDNLFGQYASKSRLFTALEWGL